MRFRTRATLFSALTAGVLFCGFAILAVRTAGETDRRLNEAHLTYVLSTLNQAVEAGLRLDMPLGELQQLNEFFQRTIADEPDIVAVEVFDANGMSSFGTDRGADGEPVSQQWLAAVREKRNQHIWRLIDGDELVLGTPVESDFGTVLGQTAIVVDAAVLQRQDEAAPVVVHMLPALALVLAGGALTGYFTAAILQRRAGKLAAEIVAGSVEVPASGAAPLEIALAAAVARVTQTRSTIRRISEELQAIDAEL